MSNTDSTVDGDIEGAIVAWAAALGDAHVEFDEDARSRAATATYATDADVVGVLRPGTREEVQEVVRIANRFGAPIYPVSRGRNWGLGSRVPARSGCAIVDLTRMNRIKSVDEDFGYMTVEPGVTFDQATRHLREVESSRFLNVTMGPPDGSLVGNAIERGHGKGPYYDRAAHTCGTEVVLPTGEVVRTGHSRHANALTAKLHRYGSGPLLDGLFTQSNFGIVTEMTFWLARLPVDVTDFRFVVLDHQVEDCCRVLRRLLADRNLFMALHSRERVLFDRNAFARDPNPARPPDDVALFGGGTILCDSHIVGAAKRAHIFRQLGSVTKGLQYMSPLRRRFVGPIRGPLKKLFSIDVPTSALRVTIGDPTPFRVWAMYSVKPSGMQGVEPGDIDLDRDRCGVMWCCPTLPLNGADLRRVIEIADETLAAQGFPPQVSCMPHNARSFDAFCAIVWDRDDREREKRAAAAFDEVQRRFEAEGYHPYRLPVQEMARASDDEAHASLLRRIKRALDPNDILAPGRYDCRHLWPRTD